MGFLASNGEIEVPAVDLQFEDFANTCSAKSFAFPFFCNKHTARQGPALAPNALRRALLQGAAALFLVAAGAPLTRAHDMALSSIDLTVQEDALLARVTIHSLDYIRAIDPTAVEDSLYNSDFLARQSGAISALAHERISIQADGNEVAPVLEGLAPLEDSQALLFVLRYPVPEPPRDLVVHGLLFPDDPMHITLLDVRENGEVTRQDFFNRDQVSVSFRVGAENDISSVVKRFIAAGIHHIFIGPDHILFIVGLMLLGGSLGTLLKIVTGFTIAHSITLTLATLGVLNPPSSVIEPLIALSIVYVGLDNLRAQNRRRDVRAWIAFGFGFIHGFGFASVLREFGLPGKSMGWALFSFNAGVELGQACIVAAVAPVMALIRAKLPNLGKKIVWGGSVAVSIAGAWWFAERVFLSP